jgi:hypothetical protein
LNSRRRKRRKDHGVVKFEFKEKKEINHGSNTSSSLNSSLRRKTSVIGACVQAQGERKTRATIII